MGAKFDRGFRHFAVTLLTAIAKLKFNTKRVSTEEVTPGALIMCNHTSVWDFANLLYTMYPRHDMRFLATSVHYDKNKVVHSLFKHLGLIRKNQGSNDLQSVKEMMKASRAGDPVIIYAAGMTSFDGRQAWEPLPGIGSMPKLLKTDVFVGLSHGSFISAPRYCHKTYRGRVDFELKRLYTAEEAARLSADELQQGISRAIRFNDWDWQEEYMVPFRHMKNLKNLSRTLYMCPACGREGEIIEKRGRLVCKACGMEARRDRYGFFSSESPACPKRMDKWVDLEISAIKRELEKENFALESEVTLFSRPENTTEKYVCGGKGRLRLTKEGLVFEGEETLRYDLNAFQFLILSDTNTIILNADHKNIRFVFEDTRLITKWFFAHRAITGIEF